MKLLSRFDSVVPWENTDFVQPFDVFNTRDVDGRTCLHIAVASGQVVTL